MVILGQYAGAIDELESTNLDDIARIQFVRTLEALSIDEGAVCRASITQEEARSTLIDLGVEARDLGIVEDDVAAGTPDGNLRILRIELVAVRYLTGLG